MYFSNGQVEYKGEFVDGKYEGEGTFYIDNGTLLYEGGFRKGDIFHEQIRLHRLNFLLYRAFLSQNGDLVYKGTFVNGIKDGWGSFYQDGKLFLQIVPP